MDSGNGALLRFRGQKWEKWPKSTRTEGSLWYQQEQTLHPSLVSTNNPPQNMRLSTKRRRLRADFPAFVCRDWVQLAPFFQQIDNVCPTDYINSVQADKRSRKESSGRKRRRAGGGAARHGREKGGPWNRCNGLMIHDGGKKTSRKHPLTTRRSLSSCLQRVFRPGWSTKEIFGNGSPQYGGNKWSDVDLKPCDLVQAERENMLIRTHRGLQQKPRPDSSVEPRKMCF